MTIARSSLIQFLIIVCGTSAFTQDKTARLAVVHKEEGSVWIINPATEEIEHKITVGDGPHEIAVSPDGKRAVTANYFSGGTAHNTLKVINLSKGTIHKVIDISPFTSPHGLTFLPGGNEILVTVENHKRLLRIDVDSGIIKNTILTKGGSHLVALNSAGSMAYGTAIGEGLLNIVDLNDTNEMRHVATGSGTEALAIRPGTNEIWIGNNRDHTIRVIDSETETIVDSMTCGLMPIRINFTPDGEYAIVSRFLVGDIAVFNAETRTLTSTIDLGFYIADTEEYLSSDESSQRTIINKVVSEGARPLGTIVDPANRFLYVSLRGQNKIGVVEIEDWKLVKTIDVGKGPDGLAYFLPE